MSKMTKGEERPAKRMLVIHMNGSTGGLITRGSHNVDRLSLIGFSDLVIALLTIAYNGLIRLLRPSSEATVLCVN